MGKRAPHVIGHQLRHVDLAHPFGDGAKRLGHVVVRVLLGAAAYALGDHQ